MENLFSFQAENSDVYHVVREFWTNEFKSLGRGCLTHIFWYNSNND